MDHSRLRSKSSANRLREAMNGPGLDEPRDSSTQDDQSKGGRRVVNVDVEPRVHELLRDLAHERRMSLRALARDLLKQAADEHGESRAKRSN